MSKIKLVYLVVVLFVFIPSVYSVGYNYSVIGPNRECDGYGHCISYSSRRWMIDADTGKYENFVDLVKLSFDNGTLKMYYKDDSHYYVKFAPFFIYNGVEYGWKESKIFMQNQGISIGVVINEYVSSYKYEIIFDSIPENIGDKIDYIGLDLIESSGLTWDDVEKENHSLVVKGIEMGYSDLISQGFTVSIQNKSRILIGNISSNIMDGLLVLDPSTGWKSPTATGDDYNEWANPTNAYVSDNAETNPTNPPPPAESQDYYNFDFDIPDGVTIDGINVTVEMDCGFGTPPSQIYINLSWDGGSGYTTDTHEVSAQSSSDIWNTTGGPADTWGRSWDSSEFSNATFRLLLTGSLDGGRPDVDYFEVIVYYTIEIPKWQDIIENNADPSNYDPSPDYGFQVNCTDDVGINNVLFEHNLTGSLSNITCSNDTLDIFYANITSMGVGVLNYSFICNNTVGNQNRSDYGTFTVNRLVNQLALSYSNKTFPETVSWSCSGLESALTDILLNGTIQTSSFAFLGVGGYNLSCNSSVTQNYSIAQLDNWFVVSRNDTWSGGGGGLTSDEHNWLEESFNSISNDSWINVSLDNILVYVDEINSTVHDIYDLLVLVSSNQTYYFDNWENNFTSYFAYWNDTVFGNMPQNVWSYATRELTGYNQSEMWIYLNQVNQSTEIDIPALITGLSNITAQDVWVYTTRNLTDYNQSEMWDYLNGMNVTIYGNVNLTASDVWSYATRELTGYNQSEIWIYLNEINVTGYGNQPSDVWGYATRTLSDYSGVWSYATRELTGYNQSEMWIYLNQVNQSTEIDIPALITGLSNITAQDVWVYTTRNLTDYNQSEMWDYISETNSSIYDVLSNQTTLNTTIMDYLADTIKPSLDSITGYVNSIASDVWGYGTRALTSFGTLVSDIWSYATRVLTSFGSLVSDIDTQVNVSHGFGLYNYSSNATYPSEDEIALEVFKLDSLTDDEDVVFECIDSDILRKTTSINMTENDTLTILGYSENIDCNWGCDNVTHSCNPNPVESNLIMILIILGVSVLVFIILPKIMKK